MKTVISAAGNLKREHPEMDEELILLRAIREANVPKFLRDDLKLFNGIVSDLFPHVRDEAVDYGDLESQIRKCSLSQGLQDVDEFVVKCIQLYETTVVRHGLMLVGPTASAKTKCYEVLKVALTNLKGQMSSSGQPYEVCSTCVCYTRGRVLFSYLGSVYVRIEPEIHHHGSAVRRVRCAYSRVDRRTLEYSGETGRGCGHP